MRHEKRHFTYANVMSSLGLFFAIAGSSAAIAAIPDDNSVDSQKVIDESLKSRDLKNDAAVDGEDVIDGALLSADIGADEVGGSEIATGAVGREEIESAAVGSGQIATNAVRVEEIYTDAVGADEIADGAVGANEIGDNAVGASEVANSAVGREEIENGSVDASEIGDEAIYRVEGSPVSILDFGLNAGRDGDYWLGEATASCATDDRDGELLAGSAKWITGDETESELLLSEIRLNMNTETVTAIGGNDAGETHDLVAEAICLEY